MTIRERMEKFEEKTLSKYATLSKFTKGREKEQEKCNIRTEFARDRDRVIHSKSFRGLTNKTQVFLSPIGDHYRTRLTHTLEVSQIARTITRALNLNEDLTEACAIAHDLGHTPFGHAGERALNDLTSFKFIHTRQGVRTVSKIENNGKGLNLTYEVKDGIISHSYENKAKTHEGNVVRISDKIAYINHDIEDAVRAGILKESELPYSAVYLLGRTKSQRISTLISSVIDNSEEEITMDKEIEKEFLNLRDFLTQVVYNNEQVRQEEKKAEFIIKDMFEYFLKNFEKVPDDYHHIEKNEGKERAICDYICSMGDRHCISVYESLFLPKYWDI